MSLAQWMDVLLSDQNPMLPSAAVMQTYLRAAWLAPLLLCALWLMRMVAARKGLAVSLPVRTASSVLLVIWILLPQGLSPAYWLGLAFNAPALMSVLLCFWLGWKQAAGVQSNSKGESTFAARWGRAYALFGVVFGYALLLDTLALLPVQLYAWGFSPAALACMVVLAVVPCVVSNPTLHGNRWALLMPAALLVFVLTRLPTGNVWDVLLDPLLWVGLQINGVLAKRVKA